MSSICWAGSQRRSLDKTRSPGTLGPFLVFTGLWAINITIVAFGLPVLIYAKLKRRLPGGKTAAPVSLSKPAHP